MVYNYKYKVEWVGLRHADASTYYYRLEIYKNEEAAFTYDVETLIASQTPFVLTYKAATDYVFEPFRSSFAEMNLFFDESSPVQPVDFYSNSDDITFKVKLKLIDVLAETETELWQGFVLNDDIQYEWQDRYYLRMSAIDNLSILKKYEYSDPDVFSMYQDVDIYEGISVKDFIVRCLGYSGNELNIKFDIRRKYGDPADAKDETSIFLNHYSAINWNTKRPREIYKLLHDVLESFGSILYQDNRDNSWTILSINSLGTETTNTIPMNVYDSAGTFVESIDYDISGSIERGGEFIFSDVNQFVTLRPSLNSVRIEYEYKRKNLLNNYGFFKNANGDISITDWDIVGTFPVLAVNNVYAPYDIISVKNTTSDYSPDFSNYLRHQFFVDSAQLPDSALAFRYQLYFQMDYELSIKQGAGNFGMISFGELTAGGSFNFVRDDGSFITGGSPSATTYIGTYPYGGTELDYDNFRALSKLHRAIPDRFLVYLRPIVQTFPAASVYSIWDNIQFNLIPQNFQYVEKLYYSSYNFGDNRRTGERNIKIIKGGQYHGGWRASDVLTYEDAIMVKNGDDVLICGKNWYRVWETDGAEIFYTFSNGTTSSILSFYRGIGRIFKGNVYAEQTPIVATPFGFPMYVSIEGTQNNEVVNETEVLFENAVIEDGGVVETTLCGADFLREFYEVPSYFFLHEATFDYFTNKTNCVLHENFTNSTEIFSLDYGAVSGNAGGVGEVGSTSNNTQDDEIPE